MVFSMLRKGDWLARASLTRLAILVSSLDMGFLLGYGDVFCCVGRWLAASAGLAGLDDSPHPIQFPP